MQCPNCYSQIPDGSFSCGFCGYQIHHEAQYPYTNQNQQNITQYSNYQSNYIPKKNNKPLIITIICVFIIALTVVLVLILGKNKDEDTEEKDGRIDSYLEFFSDKDGTYYLTGFAVSNETYSVEEMESMLGTEIVITMKIQGSSCVIDGEALDFNNETYSIEFDGNDLTLTSIYESVSGTYDPDEETIIISDDSYGISMIFEKKE